MTNEGKVIKIKTLPCVEFLLLYFYQDGPPCHNFNDKLVSLERELKERGVSYDLVVVGDGRVPVSSWFSLQSEDHDRKVSFLLKKSMVGPIMGVIKL